MGKCKICNSEVSFLPENILTIEGVPESTFNCKAEIVDLHISECEFCGAVQLFDVPLSEDYETVYRSISSSEKQRNKKKEVFKNFIEDYDLKDKKIIEIGCGDGQFLEMFKEIEVPAIGIENDYDNYQKCLDKGLTVECGSIVDLVAGYDAFYCIYFLEHMPHPVTFVDNLYSILKPNGVGLIEVPSYDYIEKNNIWLEFTKDHRFYFREDTLRYLLEKCGFKIETVSNNEKDLCLRFVVRKPANSLQNMKNTMMKDINDFKDLINSLKGSFSVYGAGHYSQLILNKVNTLYDIRPKRIFDSNKQKCGGKICGIEIEHKDNLEKDVGDIIIICGIYNDEVYKMLENKNFKGVYKWE